MEIIHNGTTPVTKQPMSQSLTEMVAVKAKRVVQTAVTRTRVILFPFVGDLLAASLDNITHMLRTRLVSLPSPAANHP